MEKESININLNPQEFSRLANNFYVTRGLDNQLSRIPVDAEMMQFVLSNHQLVKTKFKVAFCVICLNPNYWQFIKPLVEGARGLFLPGHDTDFFLWSDIIKSTDSFEAAEQQIFQQLQASGIGNLESNTAHAKESIKLAIE